MSLNKSTTFFNLKLFYTRNIGPVSYNLLKKTYGNSENAIIAMEKGMFGDKNKYIMPEDKEIREIIENYQKNSVQILFLDEDCPYEKLSKYRKMFPILTYMGNIELLEKSTMAVVGTRNPSIIGKKFTREFVNKHKNHYTIVSGLAMGIDTMAHETSISTGTVAVLPCGINVIYPLENTMLYQQIKNNGCLISFFSWNCKPQGNLFAIRNKLIAALSDITVVTEATIKSGSLMTAKYAKELQKQVFAVPGHPFDNNYGGNNQLIREGANLLEMNTDLSSFFHTYVIKDSYIMNNNDIFEMMSTNYIPEELVNKVFEVILFTPIFVGDIAMDLNIEISIILSICVRLELQGKIIITHTFFVQRKI